ncbi:LysR family transcriptional regulator [Kibdelosporangium phytohabitans]|uniref:LysR family transcriptional regulator n=1 Tax=Kibdelosporangium phytohabitans TaxID=860235 RepID=A0A0N9HZP1_9PSEU|nr:LysR substrate-binding domain-containing protein [Kibdelosporangium phytohabitans]ALG11235.1 LysR family transcriptional regulator [Kibdelosporangium phytohabitans]MBE1462515.1 DNA-binding transcriptional LysR family regulator [Kibdelosporangium phytohabitans]
MELRQLAYFVAVVEEAGFTRAAERMHVAQPGVSAQIRQLEKEFGHQLLDRSGRAVRPTEMGTAVLPYAKAALKAVDDARLAVDELAGLVRGHVAIGMVTSHPVDIPALLAAFHDDYPAVEITLAEANSGKLVDDLHGGRLDAAIIGVATDLPGLALHVLSDEALVAAVGHGDPRATATPMALTDLRDQPLICLPSGTGIRAILENACATAGFRPRVAFEAGTPQVLADLAARGLGLAILPESFVHNRPDLRPITLTGAELRGRLAWAWRANGPLSPAARAFTAQLAGQ